MGRNGLLLALLVKLRAHLGPRARVEDGGNLRTLRAVGSHDNREVQKCTGCQVAAASLVTQSCSGGLAVLWLVKVRA